MLVEFTVENYRSFYTKRSLILQAQGLKECTDNVAIQLSNNILKTLAIYGSNSSGKSNLISALQTMSHTVLSSVKLNDDENLEYDPFLLIQGEKNPTMFEVIFIKGKYCYRYGFRYSLEKIHEEWLFRKTTKRSSEQLLFIRNSEGIGVDEDNFPEGDGYQEKTNDNRLYISLCAQLGGEISKDVISWFQRELNIVHGLNNQFYRSFTKTVFHENQDSSQQARNFFKQLNLGFSHLQTREEDAKLPDNLPADLLQILARDIHGKKSIEVDSVHNIYNKKGTVCGSVNFSFEDRESAGTKKIFDLAGPIFDTLLRGSIIVVDELDAKMHPLISQHIISLFNNPTSNPNNAQLIFSTHDTHLLSQNILRRDQIWFTEKDNIEQSDLYSLMDITLPDGTKPRKDSNYEKNYIAGRYGAIPFTHLNY